MPQVLAPCLELFRSLADLLAELDKSISEAMRVELWEARVDFWSSRSSLSIENLFERNPLKGPAWAKRRQVVGAWAKNGENRPKPVNESRQSRVLLSQDPLMIELFSGAGGRNRTDMTVKVTGF
jgi:hypothetical protein